MSIVTIALVTGCGGSGDQNVITNLTTEETPVTSSVKSAGWYGKTIISAIAPDNKVYIHNTAGIFGELLQSENTRDINDVPSYGAAIFQVVFPQTTWGKDNGDYFSDYQAYREDKNQKRVWTFQIKNQKIVDLKDASIKINLDGIYEVTYSEDNGRIIYQESVTPDREKRKELILIDVDNQTSYTLEELQTANLSMNGNHVRTFRWVKGEVEDSDYAPLSAVTPAKSAKISTQETKLVFEETIEIPDSGFGLPSR